MKQDRWRRQRFSALADRVRGRARGPGEGEATPGRRQAGGGGRGRAGDARANWCRRSRSSGRSRRSSRPRSSPSSPRWSRRSTSPSGCSVTKGQPLARLDTREGELAVEAAKAALMQAEVGETRAQPRARAHREAQGVRPRHPAEPRRRPHRAGTRRLATTAAARAQLRAAETRLVEGDHPRADRRRRRVPRRQRRRPRREHGRRRSDVPHRRQPRARPHRDGAVDHESRRCSVGQPLDFTTTRVAGPDVRGRGEVHQPGGRARRDRSVKVDGRGAQRGRGAARRPVRQGAASVTGERTGVLQIPRAALLSWDVERSTGGGLRRRRRRRRSAARCRPGEVAGDDRRGRRRARRRARRS